VDAALAARWVWRGSGFAALVRVGLLPAAAVYRAAVLARNAAYDAGLLVSRSLPLPSIGVGNLAVGGTGKTPLSAWLAGELAARGAHPAIVLRGYGGDEPAEHAARPDAIVEANADRQVAARRAAARGADSLVLDDCLQRRDVRPEAMIAVIAAETWVGPRWPLPAGPWREGTGALARADLVLVTARTAADDSVAALGAILAPRARQGAWAGARLAPGVLTPLGGGQAEPLTTLRGRAVVAVSGIGEPDLFAAQLREAGADVRPMAFGDHHPYTSGDVKAIIDAVGTGGTIVTTAKDAVKLRGLWPSNGPRCLVAELRVRITGGAEHLGRLLDRVATAARHHRTSAAAAPPETRS
jgi:tetraacyldisaccharide 4'-kinase